jgi:putative aminopeptidase FrvX
VSDNTIFFAPVTDKYISMADEMKIAEPLKRAAEKGNVEAQKAVFRLYFSKALQSTKHEVSEAILSYGLTYIKTADSTQRPPLKRAVEGALENLMKTNIDKATRKRLTKLKTALLLV